MDNPIAAVVSVAFCLSLLVAPLFCQGCAVQTAQDGPSALEMTQATHVAAPSSEAVGDTVVKAPAHVASPVVQAPARALTPATPADIPDLCYVTSNPGTDPTCFPADPTVDYGFAPAFFCCTQQAVTY